MARSLEKRLKTERRFIRVVFSALFGQIRFAASASEWDKVMWKHGFVNRQEGSETL
jgi:hypothetical protein